MATTNPDLEDYLNQLAQARQNQLNPDYIAQQASNRSQNFDAGAAPQQVAAYAKAFSQLGTLGGKAADTSSVTQNAGAINQQQDIERQQENKDQAETDKDTGLQVKTLEYLRGKQDKASQLSQQRDIANMSDQRARDLANQSDARAMALADRSDARAYQLASMRGDQRGDAASAKNDLGLAKRFTEFGKDLNEGLASGRTDMGQQQKMVSAADRVLQLGDQAKGQQGGLDKRQIHEMAVASAGLVSGGGTGAAQGTIDSLVPHSGTDVIAGIEEWLTSNPKGTNQQAFVNRMLETADREKFLASEKIKGIKSGVLDMYSDLQERDPDRYAKFIKKSFGEAPQFDPNGKYVYQQYQPKHFGIAEVPAGTALAAPGPAIPKGPAVGTVMDGHQFLGGDPSKPESWKPVGGE